MVDLGYGCGRVPIYSATKKRVTWDAYVGIDIAETMLLRLLEYTERYAAAAVGSVEAVCTSADELPLESESTDLVMSTGAFLHMGKAHVRSAALEIARILRPGGHVVFDSSFPNGLNPTNALSRLKPARLRPPNFMKYWRPERWGSSSRLRGSRRKPAGSGSERITNGLFPRKLGPVPVPFTRWLNGVIGESTSLGRFVPVVYSAYSEELIP